MIIVKIFLCGLIFYIMPLLIGIGLLNKDKNDKNNLIYSYVIGNIVVFAIFQILAIPMIFIKCKFDVLYYSWLSIIIVLDIFCLIKNFKRIKEIVLENLKSLKSFPKIMTGILLLLIGIQVFVPFKYMYLNADDARYVGIATTTLETNTIFEYDAILGIKYTTLRGYLRRALSSFPNYLATVSKFSRIHPTIMAHTILPIPLILFGYAVYYEIGKKVLKLNTKDSIMYLTILSIVYIFGNYSTRTNFTYFLIRIWQGKAIVAGIIIPLTWLMFFKVKEDEKNIISWIVMVMLMFFATMVSTVGIILAPMSLLLLSFVFAVKDKKIGNLMRCLACTIPCIIYASAYFLYR